MKSFVLFFATSVSRHFLFKRKMLSLSKDKYTPKICDIVKGKRVIDSVYWHPTYSDKHANKLEDVLEFNTEGFRDMFELSNNQAIEFLQGVESGNVIENSKFFKVKSFNWTELL